MELRLPRLTQNIYLETFQNIICAHKIKIVILYILQIPITLQTVINYSIIEDVLLPSFFSKDYLYIYIYIYIHTCISSVVTTTQFVLELESKANILYIFCEWYMVGWYGLR